MTEIEVLRHQIEFMVKKFQDQMIKFDEMSAQQKQIVEENKVLKSSLADHLNLISQNNQKLTENDVKFEQLAQYIKKLCDDLDQKISSFKSAQSATTQLLASHCNVHDDLNNKVSSLQKDHEETKINVKKSSDILNSHTLDLSNKHANFKSLSSDLDQVKSSLSFCSQGHMANSALIEEIRKSLSIVIDQQSEQYKKDLKGVMDCVVHMQGMDAKILDKVNAKFDSINIPSVDGLAKLDDVKAIAKDWESIKLDAKNAYLKATNNDVLCNTLYKKLESVTLQLKSYDLTK